jgi:hypothetical protein
MNLPFLSRRAHEEIVAVYRDRAVAAETARAADVDRAQAAYADLLGRYQSLVERAAVAEGIPATTPAPAAEPDLVLQAAHERWGNDTAAMPHVARFIATERAKRERGDPDAMNERDILERVLYGVSESDGVPL